MTHEMEKYGVIEGPSRAEIEEGKGPVFFKFQYLGRIGLYITEMRSKAAGPIVISGFGEMTRGWGVFKKTSPVRLRIEYHPESDRSKGVAVALA